MAQVAAYLRRFARVAGVARSLLLPVHSMRHTSLLLALPLLLVPSLAAAQTPTAPPSEAAPPALPAPASPPPAPVVAHEASPPVEGVVKPKEVEEDRSVYLSISPLHLLAPVVELTGEVRLHRHIGVAAIGGYGSIKVDGYKPFKVWEVGGQFVGYPVGHFDHGMQVGLEVLYAGVSTDENIKVSSATANGLATGPFVGYKLATRVGFSFNAQLGVEYVFATADAKAPSGATATAAQSSIIPLLNLQAGWSF